MNTGDTFERQTPSFGYDYFTIEDLLGGTANENVKCGTIKSVAGLAGVQLIENKKQGRKHSLSAMALSPHLSTDICFPHTPMNNTWEASLVVFNPRETACDLTMTASDRNGNILSSQGIFLHPGQNIIDFMSKGYFPKGAAWVRAKSSQDVAAVQLISDRDGTRSGALNSTDIGGTHLIIPRLESNGWTGVAIVNPEGKEVSISISAHDNEGSLLARETVGIKSMGQILCLSDNLFEADISGATHIRIQSGNTLAGIQLNGSRDNRSLEALPLIPSGNETSPGARWTFMVYMAADNDLSDYAVWDINEMETVGSTSEVNVVVQTEFSWLYSSMISLPANTTFRGKIVSDQDPISINSPLVDIGNQDMGAMGTLRDFILWATENYPARHYALVLWDHGAGWRDSSPSVVRGALMDESSGNMMTMPQIARAIRESGSYIDVINFDACIMGMYEVAYELNGLTDYLVFSEASIPGYGDDYEEILTQLTSQSDISPRNFSMLMASTFIAFYQNQYEFAAVNRSTLDMSNLEGFHPLICDLSGLLIDNMDIQRPLIRTARDDSIAFGKWGEHDLGDFLARLSWHTTEAEIAAKANEIVRFIDQLIIANELYSPFPDDPLLGSTGLAVWLPQKSQIFPNEITLYEQLAISDSGGKDYSWIDFVKSLALGS